jgi:2-dehydro-3-deoxyphosphogluconate aldolase / (4S)-4-hydroxy-2-oxoglutarate aldolase
MGNPVKSETLARIHADGVVPILRTPTAQDALEMAEVLRAAGMQSIEIPLTVPGAIDAIRELAVSFSPDLLVGAGSVLNIDHAMAVHEAGATFMVMPVFDATVIAYCRSNGLACFPGALTSNEIFTAWQAGADVVKVFPASAVGGPDYIKAIKAPLPHIELMPTGGVTIENAAAFIQAGAFALGVGGDLTDVVALRTGRRQVIADRASVYLELVKEARETRRNTAIPPAAY